MPSVADKERNRRLRTQIRAGEIRALRAAGGDPAEAAKAPRPRTVQRERHISGLQWLRNKNKISAREMRAGQDWGVLYRVQAMEGFTSIKSCLNDEVGGGEGGLPPLDLEAAAWQADCRIRFAEAEAALQYHAPIIAALTCVCGRGETPREVLGPDASDREIEDLISSLRVALQMLANKWGI